MMENPVSAKLQCLALISTPAPKMKTQVPSPGRLLAACLSLCVAVVLFAREIPRSLRPIGSGNAPGGGDGLVAGADHRHWASRSAGASAQCRPSTTTPATSFITPWRLSPSGFVIVAGDDGWAASLLLQSRAVTIPPRPMPSAPWWATMSRRASPRRAFNPAAPAKLNYKRTRRHGRRECQMAKAPCRRRQAVLDHLATASDLRIAPLLQTLWSQISAGDLGAEPVTINTPQKRRRGLNNCCCGCVATHGQLSVDHSIRRRRRLPPQCHRGRRAKSVHLRGGNGSGGAYDQADMVPVTTSATCVVQCQAIARSLRTRARRSACNAPPMTPARFRTAAGLRSSAPSSSATPAAPRTTTVISAPP